MKHLLTLLFLLWTAQIYSQEPLDSAFLAEKEDSISSLYIKPIRKPEKLLRRIISRIQMDMKQKHEVCRYQVETTFSQGTLAPFFASMLISAEAGVGLEKVRQDAFRYDGPYTLEEQDTMQIKAFLIQFATLSPVHAHKAYWNNYLAWTPLSNAKETIERYNITADSIADAKGRSVLRLRFASKKKRREDFDWEYYFGEITGTAYLDSRSLRLLRFNGEAFLPSLRYETRLRYQVTYEQGGTWPVVKSIVIDGTKDDMVLKATVLKEGTTNSNP